ncbi:MAG: hypothetical protein GY866_03420 [Proteobacteria bacterium]|nr:hypothetical protein [Pseudomonadota bacterium]
MAPFKKKLIKGLLLVVPIVVGAVVFAVLMKTRPEPPHKEITDTSRKVRIIKITEMGVVPRTVGFGTVKPARVWQAVAQASGRVIYLNPLLKKGKRVDKDTVVIRIDPTEYKLSVAQAETSLQSIDNQKNQLETREENNRKILAIERQKLELARKELDRQKELANKEMSSASMYEKEERSYLAQKTAVQNMLNTQKSIESERRLLTTQRKQAEIQLKTAELQLSYTTVKVPFDCRISAVKVEEAQYVQRGQVLTSTDSIDAIEIEAQFANGTHLFSAAFRERKTAERLDGETNLGQALGLSAIVRSVVRKSKVEYPGIVLGFNASIDPQTRTPGIIVQVRNPFRFRTDRNRPPLIKGMYCEVEITGQRMENRLVVPRSAVHDGDIVYLVNSENRLESRSVVLEFSQDNFSVVKRGLKSGDSVVVTDIVPAIEGMSLTPVLDHRLAQSLTAESTGGIR